MSFGYKAEEKEFILIDSGSNWPELSTGEFKAHRRIPAQFEEQAIADSITRSVAEVKLQLESLTLPLDEQQISLYRVAVYSRSHADLMGYFAAVDHNDDKDNTEQRDSIRAESNRTVRTLLGKGRCGVYSI